MIPLSLLFLGLSLLGLSAEPVAPSAPPTLGEAPPVMKEVSPGLFELNGIRLDKKNHQISFPGLLNQREGLIEYLLVGDKGKTHESLIKTSIKPRDIHVALLLIGLTDDPKPKQTEPLPPSAIDSTYLKSAPALKGPSVSLSISWNQGGKQVLIPAEDCINNEQLSHPMSRGIWTYNGSMIEDGVFLADQELSIVSVITDPTALINNPRPGHDNDEIWGVRTEVVPPMDTPVEFIITLTESQSGIKQ